MDIALALGLLFHPCVRQESGLLPPGLKNTEDARNTPLPPEEALKRIKVPEGFGVTLFAAEPHVAQPISLAFDDRGRLWVAECFTFESAGGPWKSPYPDRILIFEDTDHDGRFDRRKVFTDRVKYVTSVLPGFGGVWVCATPELLFIPDRDRDDVPDGDPIVHLDGWNNGKIGHCVFNGLTWAPDGWLWGNQGIQGESLVGKPGAPPEERRKFNGGIWRYHPARKHFEVICEGTTNPWGLDFDDHGQAFFTNCVIGHLWHVVPGAHYKRMYGKDYTPDTYGLIEQCADHLHWAGKNWEDSRGAKGAHDRLGGGHAHAGAMIYLGGGWPDEYRGRLFMSNIHGRRLNQDLLERRGSGYVGRHGADFLHSEDPWFKGLGIKYGPDGGVFVTDWSDVGECHDTHSVHRTSGRIFKIVHGAPKAPPAFDLQKLADADLVGLQLHRNDWHVRHARRILQERASEGKDMKEAHGALGKIFAEHPDPTRKLRALWALHATGGLDGAALNGMLGHADEHVRGWAVRLLVEDRAPPEAAVRRFATMASGDPSALVRLSLASALQRMPTRSRWEIAPSLAGRAEDADDANLPLMIWYGMEPLVAEDPARALALVPSVRIPLLREYIARRAARGR